jgi:THO complex subunit 4
MLTNFLEVRPSNSKSSGPKPQPKSAASDRRNPAAKGKSDNVRGGRRRPRSSRPVKKSVDELDSEMADYFDAAAGEGQGQAQAANGDASMEDEISVILHL